MSEEAKLVQKILNRFILRQNDCHGLTKLSGGMELLIGKQVFDGSVENGMLKLRRKGWLRRLWQRLRHQTPDSSIYLNEAVFFDIIAGDCSPRQALSHGLIKIHSRQTVYEIEVFAEAFSSLVARIKNTIEAREES